MLEGQEVLVQQMDPGRLQLSLQLARTRTLQMVTAMHFIPGKNCFQVLLYMVMQRCTHCCMQWLERNILFFNPAGPRDAMVAAEHQLHCSKSCHTAKRQPSPPSCPFCSLP